MSEIASFENKVQEVKPKTKKPPMFDVILLNDDFTPMDFVVYVLKEIFNHTDQEANEIMLRVHNEGEASCGIFTKDLACLLYTSPSPRDNTTSRMPSSA